MTSKPKSKSKADLKSAWLVTWEWSGSHAEVDEPVVSVFSGRWTLEHVCQIVEALYGALKYSISEKVAVARNPRRNPYRATPGQINGVRFDGEMFCGDNLWSWARKVRNIRTEWSGDGKGILHWEEAESTRAGPSLQVEGELWADGSFSPLLRSVVHSMSAPPEC